MGARIWHLWPVAALAAGLWVLVKRLEGVEPSQVLEALGAVSPAGWLGAIVATWVSLMAVGQYDAVLHRDLKTSISPRIARRTGLIGISTAQTAGFGTLVSALVRWRCLPDWSLWEAARFSLRVSLSFLLLWSLLAAVALALWPGAPDTAVSASAAGLIAFGFVVGAPPLRRLAWRLIPKGSFGPLVIAALIDTAFAALALAFLLPGGLDIGFELYPIYLLALGAALATGAPGGLGAFELVLLALLPHPDEAALVGAILAFRMIYYLLPAFLGLLSLLRPVAPLVAERQNVRWPSEWGLVRQGAAILRAGPALWLCRERLGLGIAIGPSLGRADIGAFAEAMRTAALAPVLYKAGPREASAARRRGWQILKIAEEAIIDPQQWNPEGSSRRQLRRHPRHAAQAGMRIEAARHRLPIAEMAEVNGAWTLKNRRERGFSMGRFAPELLGAAEGLPRICARSPHRICEFSHRCERLDTRPCPARRRHSGRQDAPIVSVGNRELSRPRHQPPVVGLCSGRGRKAHTPPPRPSARAGVAAFQAKFRAKLGAALSLRPWKLDCGPGNSHHRGGHPFSGAAPNA